MKLNRRTLIKGSLATLATAFVSKKMSALSLPQQFQNDGATEVFIQGDILINAGRGGNNTADLLLRIDKDCLSHHPDLTILMVGTNDMNSAKYIPLAQYEKNLTALVLKIKKSGSKVLMATILPAYEPYLLTRHPAAFYEPEGVMGRRKQVNEVIKRIAKKNKCPCLDLEHRFVALGKIGTDKDSLLQNEVNSNKKDGLHPTANGYKFIALAIYDTILQHRLPTNRIVCFGDSITYGDGSIDRNSYPAYLKTLFQTAV
jgi:lysophospholipase L1-like esterase